MKFEYMDKNEYPLALEFYLQFDSSLSILF